MSAPIRVTLAALLSAIASIAIAQQPPPAGIDLSNLTPRTPSQKAAAEANVNSSATTRARASPAD